MDTVYIDKNKSEDFRNDEGVIVTDNYNFDKACQIFDMSIEFLKNSKDVVEWALGESYFIANINGEQFPFKIEIFTENEYQFNNNLGCVTMVYDSKAMTPHNAELLCQHLSGKLGVPYRYVLGTLGTIDEEVVQSA